MRKLLIAAFVLLTVALAYYAAFDFGFLGLRSAPMPDSIPKVGESDPNNPMDESSIVGQPMQSNGNYTVQVPYSNSVASPSPTPIPEDLVKDRDNALNQVDMAIKDKQKAAGKVHDYAHNISWAGSICSWMILGISAFLKNSTPESQSKDSGDKNPMPAKSAMVGALAVGAAVCPLTAGKMEEHVSEQREIASQLRDEWYAAIDILDPNANTSVNDWKKKIAELTDKAHL